MPREYITRLVFDRNHHSIVCLKNNVQIVAGITIRVFPEIGLGEVAFCAVDANEQVRGYGTRIMNHAKEYIRTLGITFLLTYADNNAVGYFRKQGFSEKIRTPREKWAGYIKDYDGSTLMECILHPHISYLNIGEMVARQRAAVLEKIQKYSHVRSVYMAPDRAQIWEDIGDKENKEKIESKGGEEEQEESEDGNTTSVIVSSDPVGDTIPFKLSQNNIVIDQPSANAKIYQVEVPKAIPLLAATGIDRELPIENKLVQEVLIKELKNTEEREQNGMKIDDDINTLNTEQQQKQTNIMSNTSHKDSHNDNVDDVMANHIKKTKSKTEKKRGKKRKKRRKMEVEVGKETLNTEKETQIDHKTRSHSDKKKKKKKGGMIKDSDLDFLVDDNGSDNDQNESNDKQHEEDDSGSESSFMSSSTYASSASPTPIHTPSNSKIKQPRSPSPVNQTINNQQSNQFNNPFLPPYIPLPPFNAPNQLFNQQSSSDEQIQNITSSSIDQSEIYKISPLSIAQLFRLASPPREYVLELHIIFAKLFDRLLRRQDFIWPFLEPVDGAEVPDYYTVINNPIDMTTIKARIKTECYYLSPHLFKADLIRMADNAKLYNKPHTGYHRCAELLSSYIENQWQSINWPPEPKPIRPTSQQIEELLKQRKQIEGVSEQEQESITSNEKLMKD